MRATILIAEDAAHVRQVCKTILSEHGYDVIAAVHGRPPDAGRTVCPTRRPRAASGREMIRMSRVLVVDDDPGTRMVAKILLEEAGIEVIEAANGAAALRAARDPDVDAILCDLFMPDVDGFEVIGALRRERPGLRVVAMSGGGFGGTVNLLFAARQLGAVAVLDKPFTQKQLLEAIDLALQPPFGPSDPPDSRCR